LRFIALRKRRTLVAFGVFSSLNVDARRSVRPFRANTVRPKNGRNWSLPSQRGAKNERLEKAVR
jgi:hypothetical protein